MGWRELGAVTITVSMQFNVQQPHTTGEGSWSEG